VRASGSHTRIASFTLRLAPGQLGSQPVVLPGAIARLIERRHSLAAVITIVAHDGNRHQRSVRTTRVVRLTLRSG
jgi:hypothetical protein